MMRLVDPVSLDRSVKGYGLAAALALVGIALALLLTLSLVRTLKRASADRLRLQAELRRNERLAALGKLLAGVAHEVRNPLAGIRAITQLWKRGLGVNDEAFGHLIDEVDRLEDIVSRLLQFSRADSQDLSPGDLNSVVSEAARLAEERAGSQSIKVELSVDPNLPPVEMAASALLQVIRNLSTNALQAMSDGGILRLATQFDSERDVATVFVADTGPGLTPEIQRHLFEPFFTTKAEGTGLGLAIAREIALAHRGDLQASNRSDGRGSIFTLTLPVCAVPATREGYL
jgi:two-component system, NtrC family, sensor histidine kinase HydH